MNLTTQPPSSYEEDDDDNNEEEQVVEQKQQIIQQVEEEEETLKTRKASSSVGSRRKLSKKSLLQSADGSSRNPKKQKMDGDVVVALDAKPKLVPFEELWSKEDVLLILKGLINYKETHGDMLVSTRNYEIFLQSIKDLLSFDCIVDQLKTKVRKLKEKYEKEKYDVKNPDEEKLYELSKTYWGDVVKCKAKAKAKESNELPYYYLDYFSKVNSTGYCNSLSVNLPTHLAAITSKKEWEKKIGKANAEYLNKKWKDLMIADGKLFVERCQVILDQTKVMLDVLNK